MLIEHAISHPSEGKTDAVTILFLILKLTGHERRVNLHGTGLQDFITREECVIGVRVAL